MSDTLLPLCPRCRNPLYKVMPTGAQHAPQGDWYCNFCTSISTPDRRWYFWEKDLPPKNLAPGVLPVRILITVHEPPYVDKDGLEFTVTSASEDVVLVVVDRRKKHVAVTRCNGTASGQDFLESVHDELADFVQNDPSLIERVNKQIE